MGMTKPGTTQYVSREWNAKLATLETVLAKLELLSSLRDSNTGIYIHHGMQTAVGTHTHDVLMRSHKEAFAEWQNLSFSEQLQDLRKFIASLPVPEGSRKQLRKADKNRLVLDTWTELEPYRSFVPLSISKLRRDLFLENLNSMITLCKAEFADSRQATAGSSEPTGLDD